MLKTPSRQQLFFLLILNSTLKILLKLVLIEIKKKKNTSHMKLNGCGNSVTGPYL